MESSNQNLEFRLTVKKPLEITIHYTLNNDTSLDEETKRIYIKENLLVKKILSSQKNLLVCKDLNDMLTSDFMNTISKHSLNSLKETIFYKQNIDKFSENEELMAKAVKSLSAFSNSSEINAIMREWLIENAKNISLRSNLLKQDFEYEQQILAPLYSVTTPRLVFPRYNTEYRLDFDDKGGIEYPDYLVKHNVNKLRFPNDPNEYDFSIEDYGDIHLPSSQFSQNILHKPSGNKMAVNRIIIPTTRKKGKTLYDEVNLKEILEEIELFKLMSKSPNVVDFYGFGLCGDYLYICMEQMDSTLFDKKLEEKNTMSELISGV
uniref:Protein kinase domain-containing protein n=1 Tax=Acrobeloides nanus TaxID=290746 RepID=A0A914CZN8_9BILA